MLYLGAVTLRTGGRECRSWKEEERLKWLLSELTGKRPLLPPGMGTTAEVAEVLPAAQSQIICTTQIGIHHTPA